jgi:hypothetical protein
VEHASGSEVTGEMHHCVLSASPSGAFTAVQLLSAIGSYSVKEAGIENGFAQIHCTITFLNDGVIRSLISDQLFNAEHCFGRGTANK